LPTDFQEYRLTDVRGTALKHNLALSRWLGLHKNTEFKARAAIYHIRRFDLVNAEYWKVQGAPDAATIFNNEHPLREVLFFEFLAATAALRGCVDSFIQEANCVLRLGLSETRQGDKTEVTLSTVIKQLKLNTHGARTLQLLTALERSPTNEWFRFLHRLRNTALHADLYSNSSEARNIGKILNKLQEKSAAGLLKSKADAEQEMKRDVIFHLDGRDYYITGQIHELAEMTLTWIDAGYSELAADLEPVNNGHK
jgi:hypothetical protein